MSYQDAIAGFSQLHQAFRDNADRKYKMMEKQLDRETAAEEAAKQREFLASEGKEDRATRVKTTGMQVRVQKDRLGFEKDKWKVEGDILKTESAAKIKWYEAKEGESVQNLEERKLKQAERKANQAAITKGLKGAGIDSDNEYANFLKVIVSDLDPSISAPLVGNLISAKTDEAERKAFAELALQSDLLGELFSIQDGEQAFSFIKRLVVGDKEKDFLVKAWEKKHISGDTLLNSRKAYNQNVQRKIGLNKFLTPDKPRANATGFMPYDIGKLAFTGLSSRFGKKDSEE